MTDKIPVSLYISDDVFDYFTRAANEELEDEGEPIHQINTQRRRARLMVDLLTACYKSSLEDEE